ncbi:MAG: helix-turn-helix domain-containing protein [Actinomycetota bacterium]
MAGSWAVKADEHAAHQETIRRIEQAAGKVATQSISRMDEELPWFRSLPADQRSWVTLVAQAGIASFVEWLRSPDDVLRLTGEVFAAAPRAMARSVSLQQTVELVRQTIAVAEEQVPLLSAPGEESVIREELLRFSREIAFAAARVYASAAESRGAWDARLEALVIDGLVRGAAIGNEPLSQIAALGWRSSGPVTAVVGAAPDKSTEEILADVHRVALRMNYDALAGVHGGRLVVVLGSVDDPMGAARIMLPAFADGPVVAGPRAGDISAASAVTRAALSGLRAAPGWPSAPRPVAADALLPERALSGDLDARDELLDHVYRPLIKAADVLLETVGTFLESGGALEATARALFVHANTVRYRLRRVSELCGEAATDPRGAYTIQLALTLGRLDLISG